MRSSFAYILAPLLGYLTAHILKYLLAVRKQRSRKIFFRSGNMPSSHTAVVMALTSVIFFHEGVSNLFAVVGTFAAIIIYDALVARRSIGEQGVALVKLLEKSSFSKDPLPRVALGHKPLEVVAGGALGLSIGFIVAFFITQ